MSISLFPRSNIGRYGLAVGAVAIGFYLHVALTAWLGPSYSKTSTFYPVVMAVALICGFGPGLLATALIALLETYWIMPPVDSFAIANPAHAIRLGVFVCSGVFASTLAHLYERVRHKAAAYDREMTVRKSHAALLESEERYRALAETAQDMIFIIGRDDTVTYVNTFGARSLGFRPEEVIGQPRSRFFPSQDGDRQRGNLMKVIESGEPQYTESSIDFPGGRRWLGTSLVPLHDPAGAVIAVQGISRDITAVHLAEQALRRSESRFRSLLDNSDDMVTIVDPEGRILYEASNAERIFGYPFAETEGKSAFEFVHPDDRAGAQSLFAEALAAAGTVRRIQLRIRHRDGSWHWVDMVGRNLIDDPAVGGIVLNYRDVTERKNAEEALRRHTETLEAANADLARFNRVAVDRELRMIELKRLVNELCVHLGEPPRYSSHSGEHWP